jgi:hypothetical protein
MDLQGKINQVIAIHNEVLSSVEALLSDPEDVDGLETLRTANERIEALGIDRDHQFLIDIGPLQDFATEAAPYRQTLDGNPNDEEAKKCLLVVKSALEAFVDARSYPSEWKNLFKVEAKPLQCIVSLMGMPTSLLTAL